VKTVDEVLKEYADRNNVILEQDPMAAPPMDPAAAPLPPAPMAAPPPVAPAPEEDEEEPAKPTSKERMDLVQLALDALSIDPNDLEAPEKVVFKNEVNPENAKKKRKQIETIVTYHNGTGAEK